MVSCDNSFFDLGNDMKHNKWMAMVAVALMTASWSAIAVPTVYSFTYGTHAASATFDVTGSQLTIVLANTSASDALIPTDILTAVFFNVASDPTFGKVSVITNGSTYLNGGAISGSGTAVGGEWGYANGLSQYGANTGVSSTGVGLFGPGSVFPPGTNLSGPADPDGLQYGLTSAGDNLGTGNTPLFKNELTKNAVTITLNGLPNSFSLSAISNVTFLYGTSLGDFHYTVPGGPGTGGPGGNIPEPQTLALLGLGLLVVGLNRRRRGR